MTARIATRTGVHLPSPPAPKAFGAVTPEQRQGGLCVAQFVPELHERSREDRCRSKEEGEYKMPTARPMNVEVHDITPKWRRTLSSKQRISQRWDCKLAIASH